MKRWYQGGELRELWDLKPFEWYQAILAGGLIPYYSDGTRIGFVGLEIPAGNPAQQLYSHLESQLAEVSSRLNDLTTDDYYNGIDGALERKKTELLNQLSYLEAKGVKPIPFSTVGKEVVLHSPDSADWPDAFLESLEGFEFREDNVADFAAKNGLPLSSINDGPTLAAPATKPIPTAQPEPVDRKPKKQRRGQVSQKEAAALCGVSIRTIQNWEAGEKTPHDYPGRSDFVTFKAWAMGREQNKKLIKAARAMERAAPTDPYDLEKGHRVNPWDD